MTDVATETQEVDAAATEAGVSAPSKKSARSKRWRFANKMPRIDVYRLASDAVERAVERNIGMVPTMDRVVAPVHMMSGLPYRGISAIMLINSLHDLNAG
jgi:hypothetical protein